ncbi:hypothetical protein LZ32DRAFT_31624 [Colletotrichum eremochloae]|nr:hypothetical protein LZ32DRAFT_31624 [Colletotrichum eremochloae]
MREKKNPSPQLTLALGRAFLFSSQMTFSDQDSSRHQHQFWQTDLTDAIAVWSLLMTTELQTVVGNFKRRQTSKHLAHRSKQCLPPALTFPAEELLREPRDGKWGVLIGCNHAKTSVETKQHIHTLSIYLPRYLARPLEAESGHPGMHHACVCVPKDALQQPSDDGASQGFQYEMRACSIIRQSLSLPTWSRRW